LTALCLLAWPAPAAWAAAPAPDTGPGVLVKGVVITAAVRPKPIDAPPPLEVYAKPAKFEQIALSEDGDQIAFVTTYKGMRLLAAYRVSDKSRRFVKLDAHDISAIAWADPDHVLVAASISAPRGTCDANDEPIIVSRVEAAEASLDSVAGAISPQAGAAAQQVRDSVRSLQGARGGHPCVYFGVRSESAVTSVNLARSAGRGLGENFGELKYRPLGAPDALPLEGRLQLVGPYLELRLAHMGDQPVERAYLWRADLEGGRGRLVDDGGGDIERVQRYVDDWLLDRRGAIVARSLYDYDKGRFELQMKVRGGWRPALTREISARDHTFAPFMLGLGRTGGSIVILDAAAATSGGRSFHYYELSPDGGVSGPLEPDDATRDRPLFDPDSGRLIGFTLGGESETYALFDPDLQALYQRAQDAVPGETVRVVATARDPRKMIVYAQGRADTGAYYLLDFAAGRTVDIGEDHEEVPTAWIAAQSPITYEASDGLEIHALLTLPPKPQAHDLPLIVLPHDGPLSHDRMGFDWLAQALASRGYLVLQPNYRGSNGYGPELVAAGLGQAGRKMQSDLSDGVRQLVAQGLADPKRVCILGLGFGGYEAMIAAAREPGVYRCAAALNGLSDLDAWAAAQRKSQALPEQDEITDLIADPSVPRAFVENPQSPGALRRLLGAPGSAPSPVKLAADVSIPVLILHESLDPSAPVQQSRALRDALMRQHKPVDFTEIKGADHSFATETERLEALKAVMAFLDRTNPAQ
jgi:dipeptidyl aminopeptidase/acylaminoacyl peptidase